MTLSQAYLMLAALLAIPAAALACGPGREALKSFPRSRPAGYALFLSAACWFFFNLGEMGETDFAMIPKTAVLGVWAAVSVAALRFLPDFLAVRGLAGLLLLSMSVALDAGFGKVPHSLPLAAVAYLLIVPAMFLGVRPYLLRDWIAAATNAPSGARLLALAFLAPSLGCLACGLIF